ncbi:transcription factor [Fusarium heterosporum]|uniref:Transcription factor n=1 Tax=Fusarium heterosporum TaxID=42747 RepID=A0A8H5TZ35_FUSHE|nr:transcription factor [Fusarium heterosporum]
MSHVALHATACIACRRRGRKCDRTLPACLSCEKRGAVCEGYVTKWPGVAARGKLAGKSIPVVDSSAAITNDKPTSRRLRLKQVKQNASAGQNVDGHPGSSFSQVPDDEVEKFVQHYIADLSSIFYLGNGPSDNPMFHYVLPLINTIPPIRFALAGSASCHVAARNSDEALEQKSLRLRVHATHLLREMLQNPNTVTDQAILASVLMLAQLDMCSGDCDEFPTHLQAAASIVRSKNYDGAGNRYYFEQRLVWLDVMSSTTSLRQPNLSLEEVKTIIGRVVANGGRQWSYDVFPCPVDLFEIIIEITFLLKDRSVNISAGYAQLKSLSFQSRLREWKCPFLSGPRKYMVEVWRLGIMAYLQRVFPATNRPESEALSSQLLELAELILPTTSWSYALLWPIFQIGVTLGDGAEDERDKIRRRLRTALVTIGCRHHSNALETLEVIWSRQEDHDPFSICIPGRTIMLV